MRRAWATWFVAFFLVGLGWALVTPLNQYPDEADHVYVAASVVRGEVFPHVGNYRHESGAITNVPSGILRSIYEGPCPGVRQSPGYCSTASATPGSVTVATGEGRNFPAYYALVGWPSLAFRDGTAWYLMRLVSATWCAVFLASGATIVMSMARRPLVLAGVMLVGLTPLALDLTGAVNPSGLEAASAFCFWAVLLALIHDNSGLSRRLLVRAALISGVVLTICRNIGWLWVVVVLVLSLASARGPDRRVFVRSPAARSLAATVGVAMVAMQIWAVHFHTSDRFRISDPPRGLGAVTHALLTSTPVLLQETFAYLGWLTIRPPVVAELCWIMAAVATIAIAILATRRAALVVAAGAALVVGLPLVILAFAFVHPQLGTWQGRYTLPLVLGIPLLAVACPPRAGHVEHKMAGLLASTAMVLVICGHLAVYWTARVSFAAAGHHWYVLLGQSLLAVGAIGLIANVAWTDRKWLILTGRWSGTGSLQLQHAER